METERVAIEFVGVNQTDALFRQLDADLKATVQRFKTGFGQMERVGVGTAGRLAAAFNTAFANIRRAAMMAMRPDPHAVQVHGATKGSSANN